MTMWNQLALVVLEIRWKYSLGLFNQMMQGHPVRAKRLDYAMLARK